MSISILNKNCKVNFVAESSSQNGGGDGNDSKLTYAAVVSKPGTEEGSMKTKGKQGYICQSLFGSLYCRYCVHLSYKQYYQGIIDLNAH